MDLKGTNLKHKQNGLERHEFEAHKQNGLERHQF